MGNQKRKPLRHRIPVRLRHYWKLVAGTCAFLLVLAGAFGTGMIRPYSTSAAAAATAVVVEDIEGEKDLFDTSIAHDVTITFSDANYQDMLKELYDSGEKDYLPADIVIDGTTIKDVGIRLKGNSTLMSLTWNGERRSGGMPGGDRFPEGMQPPEGMQLPEGVELPEGFPQAGGDQQNGFPFPGAGRQPGGEQPGGEQGRGRGMGFGGELKAEEPEKLPWLISFDEYVEGRRYQGHSQLAVRPAMSSAQLNEALALEFVEASGEPAQRFTYSGFTVNGRESTPRLLVEYLDEGYAEDLGNGVLYKSLASGQFAYQGGDQTEYGDDFKQVNKVGGSDLQPVIELIKWVEESSDEEFASGLGERVDVESFARYLALQNLVLNFDDMSGPGRNYYLWYDLDTRKFKVISWDMNLALNGDATTGPHDTVGMGFGGGRRPGANQQGQTQQPGGTQEPGETRQPGNAQPPGGMQFPGGMQLPEGVQIPEGAQPPGGERQGGGMFGGNKLKERFLATESFKQVYEEQYRQVYAKVFGDGQALGRLDAVVAAYNLNARADGNAVGTEAATLRTTLEKRVEALRDHEVVRGG